MSEEQRAGSIRAILHRISPLLVVAVFGAAVFLLYREVQKNSLSDIRDAILRVPKYQIVISCVLTALSYVVLMGYDFLAIKSVAHPLPLRRIALASFTGFATSYNFGALLGGGSVRFRLYSAWGLSPVEIVQLVVILAFTFWFGVFALAGAIFIVRPLEISEEWHVPFITSTYPLGFVLIALAVAYLAVTVIWHKPIRLWGKEVKLPGFKMSAAQLAVAAGDLVVAAACFYILFPKGTIGYFDFLGVHLLATVVVVLSHVPGGAAVFELIILNIVMKLSPQVQRPDVLAALLLFRLIYYLLPMLGAAALLVYFELRLRTRASRQMPEKPPQNEVETFRPPV
jgi:phosphatidylglycerol lysyltransferase